MPSLTYEYQPGRFIKIGYRTPGLRALPASERIGLAVELGMEIVEPMMGNEILGPNDAEALRLAADEMGVTIPTTGAPLPITTPDSRPEIEQAIGRYIEYCRILCANYAFCRFRPPPEGIPQNDTWRTVIDQARLAADLFGEAGIKWAVEADPGNFVNTLERVERALALVDHPNLYLNFDPTNLYVEGSDPLRAIRVLGPRIMSGHIKDGVYRTRERGERPVGEGEVDYPAVFRAIMDRGMSITMHIEHCQEPTQVRKAAKHIKSVLDSLAGPQEETRR